MYDATMHFIGGVLAVIAAGIKKVADVVRFDDFEEPFHIGLGLLRIGLEIDFITARAQRGGGRVLEALDVAGVFLADIDQLFAQDAVHAIEAAVNFLNALVLAGFANHTGHAGVDHRRGPAALCHQ